MKNLRKVMVVLFPSVDGGYVVYIPQFPECTTQGDSVAKALKNAKESLELALEVPTGDDLERVELLDVKHVVVGEIEVEVPSLAPAQTGAR